MNSPKPTVGIQGGQGSFNQAALEHLLILPACPKELKGGYEISFLFRTQKVLDALKDDEIDWGLFALWNTTTKVFVEESKVASQEYGFELTEGSESVLEELGFPTEEFPDLESQTIEDRRIRIEVVFSIPIQHYLMRLHNVEPGDVTTIMAHPQVLGQCKNNLDKLLPGLERTSGNGDQFDTAAAAKALVDGELDPNTYILGPKVLAELHGLVIDMEHPFENEKVGFQDDESNATYFALVRKV